MKPSEIIISAVLVFGGSEVVPPAPIPAPDVVITDVRGIQTAAVGSNISRSVGSDVNRGVGSDINRGPMLVVATLPDFIRSAQCVGSNIS